MNRPRTFARNAAALAGVVCLCSLCDIANAGPGDLDPSFGLSGRVSLDLWPTIDDYSETNGAIAQSDERIVAVGTSWTSTPELFRLYLARFEQDGAIDLTFGNGGMIKTIPLESGEVVIQQTDGKLVAAGSFMDDIALVRLDALGNADPAFGTDGIVQLDLGADDEAIDLLQQPGGMLVVAGHSVRAGIPDRDSDIVLVRFAPDGTLDTSFGSQGTVRIVFPPADQQIDTWETVSAIATDSAGRLLLAGYRIHERVPNFVAADLVLVRLSADGALDPSFGTGGIVELGHGTDTDSIEPFALHVLPDDRILVAGGVGAETGWRLLLPGDGFLARFMPDGSLDASFGNGGIVIENIGVYGDFRALDVLADGSIVAAGSTEMPIGGTDWTTDMTLTRFDPNGQLDDTFGEGGTAVADFGGFGSESPFSRSSGLLAQPDGKIVVVGSHVAQGWNLAMARFQTAGPPFAGLVGFRKTERTIGADETEIELTVRRTGGSTGAVRVAFETIDRGMTAGADFTPAQGELDWADGDTGAKTIVFTLLTAAPNADDAQFDVELFNPQGGAGRAASRATVATEFEGIETVFEPPPPVRGGGGSFGPLMFILMCLATMLRRPRAHRIVERRGADDG